VQEQDASKLILSQVATAFEAQKNGGIDTTTYTKGLSEAFDECVAADRNYKEMKTRMMAVGMDTAMIEKFSREFVDMTFMDLSFVKHHVTYQRLEPAFRIATVAMESGKPLSPVELQRLLVYAAEGNIQAFQHAEADVLLPVYMKQSADKGKQIHATKYQQGRARKKFDALNTIFGDLIQKQAGWIAKETGYSKDYSQELKGIAQDVEKQRMVMDGLQNDLATLTMEQNEIGLQMLLLQDFRIRNNPSNPNTKEADRFLVESASKLQEEVRGDGTNETPQQQQYRMQLEAAVQRVKADPTAQVSQGDILRAEGKHDEALHVAIKELNAVNRNQDQVHQFENSHAIRIGEFTDASSIVKRLERSNEYYVIRR